MTAHVPPLRRLQPSAAASDRTDLTDQPTDRARGASGVGLLALLGAGLALLLVLFLFLGNVLADQDDDAVTDVAVGKVTDKAYAAVPARAQKEQVLRALLPARPLETRVIERYETREPETVSASCVYYNRQDGRLGQRYRFCFAQDRLLDKTVVLPDELEAPVVG